MSYWDDHPTEEIPAARPEKAPRSAWEQPGGHEYRRRHARPPEPPRSAGTGYAGRGGTLGRVAGAPVRAVAARWDDIWPPVVGIFTGCLLGGSAIILVYWLLMAPLMCS